MGTRKERALVGVFASAEEARQAIRELRDAGVSERNIGLVERGVGGEPHVRWFKDLEGHRGGMGAAAGAVAGAVGGALWAVGIDYGVLPAVAPVAGDGGLLAAIVASAAASAVVGSLVGALAGRVVRDERTAYYREELNRGRTMVLVEGERRTDLVRAVFRGHQADDRELLTGARTEYVEPTRARTPLGAPLRNPT